MHNGCVKKLNTAQRVQVVKVLCEGCSINAIVRMTGIAKTKRKLQPVR